MRCPEVDSASSITGCSAVGERGDRRLWRKQGGERVAAVEKNERGVSAKYFSGTATGSAPALSKAGRHPLCFSTEQKVNQSPGVAQLVARLLWEQDAGSSSLPTRTKNPNAALAAFGFFFVGDSNFCRDLPVASHRTSPQVGAHFYFRSAGTKMQTSLPTRTISLWNHRYMVP